MGNRKRHSIVQRVLALTLTLAMTITLLPADSLKVAAASAAKADGSLGVVQTVDDPHTLTRPADTFQEISSVGSTLNAGKILVGKSVTDGTVDGGTADEPLDLSDELTNMPEGTQTSWLPEENNFLVTVSQSSQMYGISSKIPAPLDVVFVLDTSNSMSGGRAEKMVTAANDAIETILGMNENNRVSVVAFSSRNEGGMNNSDAAYLLSGLYHYTDGTSDRWNNNAAATDHITWNDGDIYGRSTNSSVGTVYRDGVSGGTNIQAGILLGAEQLMKATPTQVEVNGQTVKSLPILVVLSDGAPTYSIADSEWWDYDAINTQQGPGGSYRYGNGFLAALTAAYYKEKITEHYFGNSASTYNSARIYTIGVGVGEYNAGTNDAINAARLAQLTLNPSERLNDNNDFARNFRSAWNNYRTANPGTGNNAGFTIDVGQRQGQNNNTSNSSNYNFYYNAVTTGQNQHIDNVLWPSPSSIMYNDDYFPADTDDEITNAFKELVIEIQKRAITAPTLTDSTWGEDYSGYVSYTDPIGEYMEVKNIIGVTGEGYLYQGVSLSQLAEGYDPDWESDTGITEEQAAFNTAFEQAFMDRISLSTAAGAATPTLAQVRSILDVITRTAAEGDVSYDAGGGNIRTFDYDTYGGQLYYNSASDYGNSFAWFGKVHYPEGNTEEAANEDYDVQFIGAAPKNADSIDWLNGDDTEAAALVEAAKAAGANCIVRSYFMYGAAGGSREGEPADMLHFQLRVLTSMEEPHEQYVSIKAPASLLAMQKVLIDDTDPNNLEAHYEELIPCRVIYEVGLRSDINENNVWNIVSEEYLSETLSDGTLANVNADGTINFYTNDWDRSATIDSHERALTHVNFEVSNNNSFYRYETNTALYDMSGNALTTKPQPGTQYQYQRTYYTWTIEEDGQSKATKHTDWITVTSPSNQAVLDAQCVQIDGQWYVCAGVYSDETLTAGDDILKTANSTGTASVVTNPVHSDNVNDPKYTTWLGNNGKLLFFAEKPKTVTGDDILTSDKETAAKIDGQLVKVGDVLTYTIQAVNTEDTAAKIVITDTIPAGTKLANDDGNITASINGIVQSNDLAKLEDRKITWTFEEVAVGAVVKVSFQVEVLENAVSVGAIVNQAGITVGNNSYDTNITTNPVTGKQATTPSDDPIPEEGLKVGDSIEYKIAYYNPEDKVATITITDVVPKGTTFNGVTSHPSDLTWDKSTDPNTLTWVLENIQPGAAGVVTFTVVIHSSVEKITVDGDSVLGVQNSASYIIVPENEPEVTIVTNPTFTPVDTGDLWLKKDVEPEGVTPDPAAFELVLTESTGMLNGSFTKEVNGTESGTVEFVSGTAKVSIEAGQTIVIKDLPENVIITVSETARAGYTPSFHLGEDKNAEVGNTVTISSTTVGKVFVLNTYSADDTDDISTMFSVKKTLTSPVDLPEKSFTFLAQAANENGVVFEATDDRAETLTASGTVEDGQTIEITFNGKSFAEAGTYYYLVTEFQGVLENITYDKTQYLVKIEIEDNKAGQLIVKAVSSKSRVDGTSDWSGDFTASTDLELQFTNSYQPEETSIVLTGNKSLTGRKLIAGEFTFVARETGNTDLDGTARTARNVVRYGHHDADGKITFDPIYYSEEGRYTYEIAELDTTGQQYVDFDDTTKYVTVVVTSKDGVLSAAVEAGSDEITFSNKYETQDVSITPAGTKTLVGRPMEAGEFSFEVIQVDGTSTSVESVGSVAAGASGDPVDIKFTPITYELADLGTETSKEFTYIIKELVPSVGADAQMTYDKSEYTFTVTVTLDSTTGVMTAVMGEVKQTKDSAGNDMNPVAASTAFTNKFTPPPVDVEPGDTTIGLGINKVINSSSEIPAGLTFGFTVYKADEAYALDEQGNVSTEVINDGYEVYTVTQDGTNAAAALVGTGTSTATTGEYVSGTAIPVGFTELTFSQPGVYKAWIVEANAGAQDLHGVTYTGIRYLMVITITHNTNTGSLEAAVDYYEAGTVDDAWTASAYVGGTPAAVPLEFENTYAAKGNMIITATKAITGRKLADVANEFDFTLTELAASGNLTDNVHVGKNDAEGNIVFDTLNFAEFTGTSKTLTYLMAETVGMLDGIDYDESQYKVEITLTNESNGVISSKITSITRVKDKDGNSVNEAITGTWTDGNTGIAFANVGEVYKGTNITIPVSKKLTGRDMQSGEFGFTLTHVATNGTALATPVVVGTVISGAKADGVVDEAMSFYREYGITVAPNTIVTYHIAELPGSKGGVTYDKSVYEVTVKITDDDQNGELEIKAENVTVAKIKNADGTDANTTGLTMADVDFANEYKVSSTTLALEGAKTLTGRDIDDGEFVFEVYERNADGSNGSLVTTGRVGAGEENKATAIVFDPITYYAEGTHVYNVVEEAGNRANVTYSDEQYVVTVVVEDKEQNGTLTAGVTKVEKVTVDAGSEVLSEVTDKAITFTNVYKPTALNVAPYLEIDKVLTGRGMLASEFSFVVRQLSHDNVETTGKPIVTYGDNVVAEDGQPAKLRFASFTVEEAGTYVYEISESTVAGHNVKTDTTPIIATVVIEDDGHGTLSVKSVTYADNDQLFENVYSPTPVAQSLVATKYLTGMTMNEEMFEFKALLEKKDSNNSYQPFLAGDPAKQVQMTAKNETSGLVNFGTYEFTEAGEYRWTVEEVVEGNPDDGNSDDGIMAWDNSKYYVQVVVQDNAATGALSIASVSYKKGTEDAASIVFENVFQPTEQPGRLEAALNPNGSKVLVGRAMEAGEFSFSVKNTQGQLVATGANNENGTIVFDYDVNASGVQNSDTDGIKFSSVGTYIYTITEDVPEGEDKAAGVSYDAAEWVVLFEVTQVKDTGALIVNEPSIIWTNGTTAAIEDGIVFTNTYDPADAEVVLKADKTLTGRDMIAGEFEFHLLNAAGNIMARGYNDADGVIVFDKLVLSSATTAPLEYTVVEVKQSAVGITYDDTKVKVQISVADDPDTGKLVPTVTVNGALYDEAKTGDQAQIKFTNTYKGLPANATVQAKKVLNGRDLVAGEFKFELAAEAGNPGSVVISEGTNDAEGNVEIHISGLAETGRYTFLMKETKGTDATITYSSDVWKVYVDVTDPGTGQLEARVNYAEGNIPLFTNTYIPNTVAVKLEGVKTLTGREMKVGEFTFVVKDSRGATIATGTNGVGGRILFSEFKLAEGKGQKIYVSEMQTGAEHVTFDKQVYCVTVDVTKDVAKGTLVPIVHYPESGIVFNNSYKVPDETTEEDDGPQPADPLPETPDTGDNASVGLWIAALFISMSTLVVVIAKRRSRRNNG